MSPRSVSQGVFKKNFRLGVFVSKKTSKLHAVKQVPYTDQLQLTGGTVERYCSLQNLTLFNDGLYLPNEQTDVYLYTCLAAYRNNRVAFSVTAWLHELDHALAYHLAMCNLHLQYDILTRNVCEKSDK